MKTLDSVFAALQKLRGDVAELNAALLNHERTLAAGRRDSDLAELHGFISRMTRVTAEMHTALAEQAPTR